MAPNFDASPGDVRERSALFDWLKDLDSKAQGLSPARSWLDYPYFMFARYPRLRPEIPEKESGRTNNETGYKSFLNMLSNQESKIANHEHGAHILQSLTPDPVVGAMSFAILECSSPRKCLTSFSFSRLL